MEPFAIANQIENFVIQFVNNLNTAATPQITQYYSSNDKNRAFALVEKVSKYSIYVMLLIVFPVWIELEFLLKLWLGTIPDQTLVLCQWTLLSIFIRSIAAGIDPIIQATGQIKWYQLSATIVTDRITNIFLPLCNRLQTLCYNSCIYSDRCCL